MSCPDAPSPLLLAFLNELIEAARQEVEAWGPQVRRELAEWISHRVLFCPRFEIEGTDEQLANFTGDIIQLQEKHDARAYTMLQDFLREPSGRRSAIVTEEEAMYEMYQEQFESIVRDFLFARLGELLSDRWRAPLHRGLFTCFPRPAPPKEDYAPEPPPPPQWESPLTVDAPPSLDELWSIDELVGGNLENYAADLDRLWREAAMKWKLQDLLEEGSTAARQRHREEEVSAAEERASSINARRPPRSMPS